MKPFEIGTRVRLIDKEYSVPYGSLGTILDKSTIPFVEFDDPIKSAEHWCPGKKGHTRPVAMERLEIAPTSFYEHCKTGNIVVGRNGDLYIVIDGVLQCNNGFLRKSDQEPITGKSKSEFKNLDMVSIYEPNEGCEYLSNLILFHNDKADFRKNSTLVWSEPVEPVEPEQVPEPEITPRGMVEDGMFGLLADGTIVMVTNGAVYDLTGGGKSCYMELNTYDEQLKTSCNSDYNFVELRLGRQVEISHLLGGVLNDDYHEALVRFNKMKVIWKR